MCHDDDSRPPSPPVVGEVASHNLITLTAADGNSFAAYVAVPATPNGKNVVILPDVRGLYPYYEQLAVRFAEAGFHAVAFDYFGRDVGVGQRDDDFDWQTELAKLTPEYVAADAGASAEYLRAMNPGPVFTVGFCFGGSNSWRLSASDLGLAGCIGFYGQPKLLADFEARLQVPMLMLVAGDDFATPSEEFVALEARLTASGVDHEMVVFEGAPHSFFDRSFGEWAQACTDSWNLILAFTDRLS